MDWKDVLGSINLPSDEKNDDIAETVESPRNISKSVTLFYERKGRAGKPATILAEFVGVNDAELNTLASRLKSSLGTGGSCRGGEILIQGDRREQLRQLLAKEGFKVKG